MKKSKKVTLANPTSNFVREVMKVTGHSFSHVNNVLAGRVSNNEVIEKAALKLMGKSSSKKTRSSKPVAGTLAAHFNPAPEAKVAVKAKTQPRVTNLVSLATRREIAKKTGYSDSYVWQVLTGRKVNKTISDLAVLSPKSVKDIPQTSSKSIVDEIAGRTGFQRSYVEKVLAGEEKNTTVSLMAKSITPSGEPVVKKATPASTGYVFKHNERRITDAMPLNIKSSQVLEGISPEIFSKTSMVIESVTKNIKKFYGDNTEVSEKDVALVFSGFVLNHTLEQNPLAVLAGLLASEE